MGRVSKGVKQKRLSILNAQRIRLLKNAILKELSPALQQRLYSTPASAFSEYINYAGINYPGTSSQSTASDFPTAVPPTTGGLQQSVSQHTSETAVHCLLCSKETTQNLTSLNNYTDKEADFLVMFLLKKMLGTASENLAKYLRTLGHPRNWVSFCDICSSVVAGALAVQKQIGELEGKLRTFQDKMKEKIMRSYIENQKKFQSFGAVPASVVTKETRDYVVFCELQRIRNQTRLTTHSTEPPQIENLSVDKSEGDTECDDFDCDDDPFDFFDRSNTSPVMSNTPEPSHGLSNAPKQNKRKQTLTVRKEELTAKDMTSDDVTRNRLKENHVAKEDDNTEPSMLTVMTKLMKFKQVDPMDVGIYWCAMCPKLKSMRLRSFVKHLVYHYDRPYKCSECSAYWTGSDIEMTQCVSENQSGSHICRRETLVKVNLETEKIWECGHCSEAFKSEDERELHEASAHSKKASIPLPHKCSRCPKKFRDYPEWEIHRALEHPDLTKLVCFYCDEIFKFEVKGDVDVVDSLARNKHIKEHHGQNYANADPLECRTCGVNFQNMDELKSHARDEHGNNSEKLIWCPLCFKSWKYKGEMQVHIQRVHGQKPREKFICDLCAYKTVVPSLLTEHRFLVHGLEPENKTSKSKVYSCTNEGCSFKCLLKGTFDTHMMKIHNAERRIKCRICGRGFLSSKHRNDHERTHDVTTKPFQCEICGNSFAVKNYLYIHMRLSHQNRPFASTNKKRTPKAGKKSVGQNPVENSAAQPPLNLSLPDCVAGPVYPASVHPVSLSLEPLSNSAASQSTCEGGAIK